VVAPFTLHRPRDVSEASALLSELGDSATVYCGGTELLLVMKMGLAAPEHLIDLKGIASMARIDVTGDGALSIGAAVTHREIERSPLIARHLPALAELEKHVANVRVRNAGSLGGNLCFAEPHSDPATLLVAADATLHLSGRDGAREVPMRDFIVGALETVREPDEILVSVSIPATPANMFLAYRKIAFKERPVASVAVRVSVNDGLVDSATIVVGSVGDRPLAIDGEEEVLVGTPVADAGAAIGRAADVASTSCEAAEADTSEEYQRHLVRVLARRALTAAMAQASEWSQ
jgi:carbon-monoxide dehydrogenase medium subunit